MVVIPPAEFLADLLHGRLGDLPYNINGNLPSLGDGGVLFVGADVGRIDAVGLGNLVDDPLDGDGHGLVVV